MRFAFALYKYFPFGGLQCDMLRMAEEALRRGHFVTVFTSEWNGEKPKEGIEVRLVPVSGLTNHGKMASFGRNFLAEKAKSGAFDAVVAFNRVEGGDFYFAADNCLAWEWKKKHSFLTLKLLPRYRAFLKQEKSVCLDPACKIMYIVERQKGQYKEAYGIPDDRFVFLPPGMNGACRRRDDAEEVRKKTRQTLGLADDEFMLILVGSDFRRKGGDRAVRALASLPDELRKKVKLFLVGNCKPSGCDILAERLGIAGNVTLTGGRSDVPSLLLGADLMIHPARSEATGTVIIEALASGLPVIASDACGFASYAANVDEKLVTPEPFEQDVLNAALERALKRLPELKEKAVAYGTKADFYSRASFAVDAMEECGRNKTITNLK